MYCCCYFVSSSFMVLLSPMLMLCYNKARIHKNGTICYELRFSVYIVFFVCLGTTPKESWILQWISLIHQLIDTITVYINHNMFAFSSTEHPTVKRLKVTANGRLYKAWIRPTMYHCSHFWDYAATTTHGCILDQIPKTIWLNGEDSPYMPWSTLPFLPLPQWVLLLWKIAS